MNDPIYILIRTSKREKFFFRMMQSVKEQTYPNITTIVHTDDPEDSYVEGDIIISGERLQKGDIDPCTKTAIGEAPYNLYCNTLLENIPDEPGWFHFLDDDDMYAAPEVLEKIIPQCKKDHINVFRVHRWNNSIYPMKWKAQKTFQTECFILHTSHKDIGRWWSRRGGDHYYTKQITDILPINWIDDIIVCRSQEGKGHGIRMDAGQMIGNRMSGHAKSAFLPMTVLFIETVKFPNDARGKAGEIKNVPQYRAYQLEHRGKVIINPTDEQIENKDQLVLNKRRRRV